MKEFTVTENDSGQRLDKFITKLMPRLPQSMMYKGFRKNCVKLNGKHAKNGAVFVEKGDTVALYFKDEFFETNREFKYTPYELDIVYEDDNILVINKAPGILSHSDEHGCGLTVIDMVQSYLYDNGEYNPQTSQTFKPALCNRLDRNTGGLIISAKNSLALREINSNIKRRNIQSGSVFVTRTGKPLDRCRVWKLLKGLCESANVSKDKVFPHNLRHLFARTFYSLQKDIVRLADILGHSSVNTTRIYTMESGIEHQKQLQAFFS